MRFSVLLLGLALALGAGAQIRSPRSAHERSAAKPLAALPDAELEKAIRARFAASKIASNHFEVHVQGGIATLEGKTDVIQHKGTATRLAKAAGASGVLNRIVVSDAARERAAKNLAKGRRRAQITRGEPRSGPK